MTEFELDVLARLTWLQFVMESWLSMNFAWRPDGKEGLADWRAALMRIVQFKMSVPEGFSHEDASLVVQEALDQMSKFFDCVEERRQDIADQIKRG